MLAFSLRARSALLCSAAKRGIRASVPSTALGSRARSARALGPDSHSAPPCGACTAIVACDAHLQQRGADYRRAQTQRRIEFAGIVMLHCALNQSSLCAFPISLLHRGVVPRTPLLGPQTASPLASRHPSPSPERNAVLTRESSSLMVSDHCTADLCPSRRLQRRSSGSDVADSARISAAEQKQRAAMQWKGARWRDRFG